MSGPLYGGSTIQLVPQYNYVFIVIIITLGAILEATILSSHFGTWPIQSWGD